MLYSSCWANIYTISLFILYAKHVVKVISDCGRNMNIFIIFLISKLHTLAGYFFDKCTHLLGFEPMTLPLSFSYIHMEVLNPQLHPHPFLTRVEGKSTLG